MSVALKKAKLKVKNLEARLKKAKATVASLEKKEAMKDKKAKKKKAD